MLDSQNSFQPEKITIVDFKMVKGQVDVPEDFDTNEVQGFNLENSLQLGFNLDDKLIKADFTINIETVSKANNNNQASGNFHLVFIYRIENLNELAKLDDKKLIELDPALANAISSLTYSTARGILITRLQGTALQNFMLPVINPSTLLHNK
ncbi:MAG: hypothetical protein ACR2IL_06205 [Chitinophagaceae bacterium]